MPSRLSSRPDNSARFWSAACDSCRFPLGTTVPITPTCSRTGTLLALFLLFQCSTIGADFGLKALKVDRAGEAGFTLLAPQSTGVAFTNSLSDASAEQNRILENGSGVALGDIDGDGHCDIFLCGLEQPNALFRNLGNWKFEMIADAGGASCKEEHCTGAVLVDLDNDNDLDLLVNGIATGTRLFRNDGKGRFTEDATAGLDRRSGATSLAIADVEGDGDLDVYVVTYRSFTIRDGATPGFEVTQVGGKLVAKPEDQFEVIEGQRGPSLQEKGEADILYLNDGAGKFTPASWTDGRFLDEDGKPLTRAPRGWGLAAMFRDLNNDLAPDLYVCNDFLDSGDDIWINDGKGNFRRIDRLAIRHTSWSSMAVDVADINRDGFMDIFVADMLSPDNVRRQTQRSNAELAGIRHRLGVIDDRPQNFQNTLQLNRGDGTFAEIAQLAGLQATDWTWAAAFLDVDLDGWEDLLVTTGNGHDIQDSDTSIRIAPVLSTPPHIRPKVLLEYPVLKTPKRAFRNNRDLTFSEAAWGFDQIGISHGLALGDLDGDGDLDVVVNNMNEAAGVYRNNSSAPRIAVRLNGTGAVGSIIEVESNGLKQRQEVVSGGRYLSGDEGIRTFAAAGEVNLRVRWRNGAISSWDKLGTNLLVAVSEPKRPENHESIATDAPAVWFEDASHLLKHQHEESAFDDWALQPLLPNRLGNFGPDVCVEDIMGNGSSDIIIGASRGQAIVLFANMRDGSFNRITNSKALGPGDYQKILALPKSIGNRYAIGISNLEIPKGEQEPSVVFFILGAALDARDYLPTQTPSVGPLAAGDIDRDGTPELFIGSRFIPGRYPESGPSRMARYDATGWKWKIDRRLSAPFENAGMITGAEFGDFDRDGALDLILATDWGSPKLYRNQGGILADVTEQWGLSKFTGRWNNVLVADFDRDGYLDILLAGWGRNTKFQRYLERPVQVAYADFNGDGKIELIESVFDPTLKKYVPWRGRVSMVRHIPGVEERFPSFVSFGSAGTSEILEGKTFKTLEVSTLDTILLLNKTNYFVRAELPVEAQFAPVFDMVAADFNADGNLDVFLAQNFFALHDEVTRMDAGRGLLLEGDGRSGFRAVPGQESGLLIYGEQRGCATGDFNHDGKIDLVVTQNSGPTKLYLNRTRSR